MELRWRCRRGMLELDSMLLSFLEHAYDDLNDQEQSLFLQLLDYKDQTLLECLTGQQIPTDRDVHELIQRIRQTASLPASRLA